MKNIYLCGFMGCGKSTVGKYLSKILNCDFVDMDTYIEEKSGEKVSEIFKNHGEEYFRKLEHDAALDFSKRENFIIATGGGAVLNENNVKAFKKEGIIVFLHVPLEIIKKRLFGDTSRPLLLKTDKDKIMKELYYERLPLYTAASDITVLNDTDMSADDFAKKVIVSITEFIK